MSAKPSNLSRRTLLSLALSLPLVPLLPSPSHASLTASEAFSEASAARASTPDLRTLLELEEWETFRRALRGGPMSRVRASCSSLARLEPEENRERAQKAYKTLVKAVEDVDFAAGQRERGKKPEVVTLLDGLERDFDRFLHVVGGKE